MKTIVAVCIALLPAWVPVSVPSSYFAESGDTAITEDDPRWDCATMGNHVCGPVITSNGIESDTGAFIGGWN